MYRICGFGLNGPIPHIRKVKTIRSKRHKRLIELIVAERKRPRPPKWPRGIGQVQLAKKLKRSQTWIARLEGGERRLDVIELIDLAEAVGFDAPGIVAIVQQSKK